MSHRTKTFLVFSDRFKSTNFLKQVLTLISKHQNSSGEINADQKSTQSSSPRAMLSELKQISSEAHKMIYGIMRSILISLTTVRPTSKKKREMKCGGLASGGCSQFIIEPEASAWEISADFSSTSELILPRLFLKLFLMFKFLTSWRISRRSHVTRYYVNSRSADPFM